MNDDPSLNLATRREQLRLLSAQLREQIAVRSQVFQPAFRATDRVRGGVRSVRGVRDNRALLMLGGAALAGALLVRPRALRRSASATYSASVWRTPSATMSRSWS